MPFFIVHLGYSYYLDYVLNQVKYTNPSSEIILIGDEANAHLSKFGITHINYKDYFDTAAEFAKIYKHYNDYFTYSFMLNCFQRFMFVRDYILKNGITGGFFFCDSDVLIYDDITAFAEKYLADYDFSLHGIMGPGCNYFKDVNILNLLINKMFEYYTNSQKLNLLENCYNKYNSEELTNVEVFKEAHGVTEMSFLAIFIKECGIKAFDLLQIVDDTTFDSHLAKDTDKRFVMEGKFKKIKFINSIPYVYQTETNNLIKINMLHFQGYYKRYMFLYYTASKDLVPSKMAGYFNLVMQILRLKIYKLLVLLKLKK